MTEPPIGQPINWYGKGGKPDAREIRVPAERRFGSGSGMAVLTTTEMERADRLTIPAARLVFALIMSAGQACPKPPWL